MDPATTARAIIDAGAYMTLATADEEGRPWASPVWFARTPAFDLLWISRPEARHSQNLAVRPELAIVIFDSHAPIGTGQGVYFEATAELVPDDELEQAAAIFSARSRQQGGEVFTTAEVTPPAEHRMYRARIREAYLLGARDQRDPVSLT
jgi:nitroimidazol reductase NimA-like FMN-containing flavoprotein (pyridoxamine 5'-phosphate oxidase superfamily)